MRSKPDLEWHHKSQADFFAAVDDGGVVYVWMNWAEMQKSCFPELGKKNDVTPSPWCVSTMKLQKSQISV
jgi:hypothetical protein